MAFNLESPIEISYDSSSDSVASLFIAESDHTPSLTSLHLSPIRLQIISLILQFCRKFDPFLSYLSINYLDRFLSTPQHHISEGKPWILRLLAVSCVSLAMKMGINGEFISLADINEYDDDEDDDGGLIMLVIDTETIKRMEMLILGALKWRMRSITAFAFNSFFISFFKFKDLLPSTQALKTRATEIILSSQYDVKILEYKSSIISASALLTASHELFPLQFPCYQNSIINCSFLNKENLLRCYNIVEEIAMERCESSTTTSCSGSDDVETQTHKTEAMATNYTNTATIDTSSTSRVENEFKKRKMINVLLSRKQCSLNRVCRTKLLQ